MINNFYKNNTNLEMQRILELKNKYDNGEISEEELSDKEIYYIVKLYNEETKKIEDDTNKRKFKIKKMLLELRNS